MMACNKKGPCKEEKSKNVEKLTDEQLTDEKLDEVAGGTLETWPQVPLPFGAPTVMPPMPRYYCSPSERTDPFRDPRSHPPMGPSINPFSPLCKPVLPPG